MLLSLLLLSISSAEILSGTIYDNGGNLMKITEMGEWKIRLTKLQQSVVLHLKSEKEH